MIKEAEDFCKVETERLITEPTPMRGSESPHVHYKANQLSPPSTFRRDQTKMTNAFMNI